MSEHVEAPERQFDFWLGEWDVLMPDGRVAGRNRIKRVLDGAALAEHWRGVRGLTGRSLSAWIPGLGRWHQTWVDSSGALLLLDGGLRDGAMVLEGAGPDEETPGGTVRHRISWSRIGQEGARGVRQLWEVSRDDGRTWEVAFDGRYRPA